MLKPLWIAGMSGVLFDKITGFCRDNSGVLTEKISQMQHHLSTRFEEQEPVEIDLAGVVAELSPKAPVGGKKADTKFFWADSSLVWTCENWDACLAGSYLLFYQSPLAILKNIQRQDDSTNPGEILRASMAEWLSYHQRLIEVFNAHPKKALLLRLDGATVDSVAALRKKLEGAKSFAKGFLPEEFYACLLNDGCDVSQECAADEDFLAAVLARAYPECHQLFLSLEALAWPANVVKGELAGIDLQGLSLRVLEQELASRELLAINKTTAQQLCASQEQLTALLSERAKTSKAAKAQQLESLKQREQELVEVKAQLEAALLELHQLREAAEAQALVKKSSLKQLAVAEQERKDLLAELAAQASSLKNAQAQVAQLQNESGLLLLQLHQVQETCEAEFLAQKTLAGKLEILEKEKGVLSSAQEKLSDSLKKAELQVVELTNQNKAVQAQLNAERKQFAEKQAAMERDKALLLAGKEAQLADLKNDSELMLLQLHQVQEELELYFLECERIRSLLESYRKSERETRCLVSKLLKVHLVA